MSGLWATYTNKAKLSSTPRVLNHQVARSGPELLWALWAPLSHSLQVTEETSDFSLTMNNPENISGVLFIVSDSSAMRRNRSGVDLAVVVRDGQGVGEVWGRLFFWTFVDFDE